MPAVREPQLAPAVGRSGGQEFVVGLVEKPPGLGLGVLAVLVGQQVDPDLAGPGKLPDPDLAAGHVVIEGPVAEPGVALLVPCAVEVLALADGEVALRGAEIVVTVIGQVAPQTVDGPGLQGDVVVVADLEAAGKDVAQVVGRMDGPAGPIVIGLAEGRRVVPGPVGLEIALVLRQADRNAPTRPGGQVHGSHDAADAAVGVPAQHVVDGRGRGRGMADDAEIEFDPARRPGPAQGDLPELEDVVGVEEFLPRALVRRPPDLAADLGQDGHRDVRILQAHHGPFLVRPGPAEFVKEIVGIKPGPPQPTSRSGRRWGRGRGRRTDTS